MTASRPAASASVRWSTPTRWPTPTASHSGTCATAPSITTPIGLWILGAPLRSEPAPVPEIDVLRRAIVAETGGEAAYFLDFHSHAGWYDRFKFYADGDDPAVRELVEAIARADDGGDGGLVGTECVGGSGSGRQTSTRWARETLGETGLTVEATPHGSPSMKRYRRAGGSFVEGLAATVD